MNAEVSSPLTQKSKSRSANSRYLGGVLVEILTMLLRTSTSKWKHEKSPQHASSKRSIKYFVIFGLRAYSSSMERAFWLGSVGLVNIQLKCTVLVMVKLSNIRKSWNGRADWKNYWIKSIFSGHNPLNKHSVRSIFHQMSFVPFPRCRLYPHWKRRGSHAWQTPLQSHH